jgi:enamine deaminase RidA (YjgF/YER057c/UK114 family)
MSMTNERFNYASNSPWEPLRGYSRAVRVGNHLYISGTTAIDSRGDVVSPGEAYKQTAFIIDKLRDILKRAGGDLSHVVRTRLFVTNLNKWEEYAQAHREAFEKIRPASSIVQVTRLVDPRLTIEMEVDAVLGSEFVEEIKI